MSSSVRIRETDTNSVMNAENFLVAVEKVEGMLGFKISNFIQTKKDFDRFGRYGFHRKGRLIWIERK